MAAYNTHIYPSPYTRLGGVIMRGLPFISGQLGAPYYVVSSLPGPPVVPPPSVAAFSPPLAAAIGPRQPLALEVTGTDLQRVVLLVDFPGLNTYEVAHDGSTFSSAYPARVGNTREAITDGFRFTLLRQEGWPASPRVIPMAFDSTGGLNPIDSVVYAWTLLES